MTKIAPPMPDPALSLTARLRALTPARVGFARTGVSQHTRDQLNFQQCHAMARDAVHARLQSDQLATEIETISGTKPLLLKSAAPDRAIYLQRPDLGRCLNEPSRQLLARAAHPCDLAIVVADGLSALAVERHVCPLLGELLPLLSAFTLAPISIVEQGRVAIGDEIGFALGAKLVVVLIGERPGLSSPDSLGAYITWDPRPGRTDAERNCISNIRTEGLSYTEAALQLSVTLAQALKLELTGVSLKINANLLQGG